MSNYRPEQESEDRRSGEERRRAHDEAQASRGATTPQHRTDEREDRLEAARRDEFGGVNWGAAFFGWLVAIALSILLTGIFGAIAAGIGSSTSVTQTQAERSAGTIATATAIALLVILMIGYFAGGYVAGRMSRFDGGRQGAAVWVVGLIITIIVVVIGLIFGDQYDIFARVDLPSLPIPTDQATAGGLITLAAVILTTLLTAYLGGKAGQHYHAKIDRINA